MAIFDESAIIRKYIRSINFLKGTPPHPTKASSTTSRDSDADSYSSFSISCQSNVGSDRIDSIKSCESVLKIFTFETNAFNKNNEKCLAFWNAINSREDIQPVNCTIMDAQCNRKSSECQTEEKESEASLWARALYELRKRKLDKVAMLTSTTTCEFCKTINCRHISSPADPKDLLGGADLTELDNWSPRRSNKTTQVVFEEIFEDKTPTITSNEDFTPPSDNSELNVIDVQVLPGVKETSIGSFESCNTPVESLVDIKRDIPPISFGKRPKSNESVSEKKRVSILDVAHQSKSVSTSQVEPVEYKFSKLSGFKSASHSSTGSSLIEMKSRSRDTFKGSEKTTQSSTGNKLATKIQYPKSGVKEDHNSSAITAGQELSSPTEEGTSAPVTDEVSSSIAWIQTSDKDLKKPGNSSAEKIQAYKQVSRELVAPIIEAELQKRKNSVTEEIYKSHKGELPKKSSLKTSTISFPPKTEQYQQFRTTSKGSVKSRASQKQINFLAEITSNHGEKSESTVSILKPAKEIDKRSEIEFHSSLTEFSPIASEGTQVIEASYQELSLPTGEDDLHYELQYSSGTAMVEEGSDMYRSRSTMEHDETDLKDQSTDTPHLSSLLNVETLKHLEFIAKRKKKLEDELRKLQLLQEGNEIDPKIYLCSCLNTLRATTCDECDCKHGICRKPNQADLQMMEQVVDHLPYKERRKLSCFLKILYKIREIMKMNLDQQTSDDMIVEVLTGLGPCECEGGSCECRLHHLDVATMNADADFFAATIMDRFNKVLDESIQAKLGVNLAQKRRYQDKEVETEEVLVSHTGVPETALCNICKLQNCLCIIK